MHAVLIGAVGFWMARTGRLEKLAEAVLQYVRSDKMEEIKAEQKPIQTRAQPAKLPPINQGVPPPPGGGGTRRAVAGDAPAAAGETFFQDTRQQVGGPSTAGSGGSAPATNAPPPKPPPRTVAPRLFFDAAAKTNVGTVAKLLQERASAAAVQDAFGSEQISRSGTSSAADVVTKITGATVVEGRHAVIRGLADRYNMTTLNGAEVPSSDPYRKSVQVDIFSAEVIEKVVTTKTFTPDQPGSATGGKIDIVTKSFPARPFLNLSLETGFNPNANLNDDFLVAPGSKIDLFGLGNRPDDLPGLLKKYPIGSQYPEVPSFQNSSRNETQARAEERRQQANLASDMLRALGPAGFQAHREKAPLNTKYAFSAGETAYLFDKPLGIFVAGRFAKKFGMYDQGIQGRYTSDLTTNRIMSDTRAIMETDFGGSVNLAYQVAPDQELGFNFLFNRNIQDEARQQTSAYINPASPMSGFDLVQLQNHYTERELQVYQARGKHLITPLAETQLDWMLSFSTTRQDEPDYRFYHVLIDAEGRNNFASNQPQPDRPARYFRELNEQNLNFKIDDTTPFLLWGRLPGSFKFGFYSSSSERDFFERTYLYRDDARSGNRYVVGPPNGFLTENDLGYTTVNIGTSTSGVGRTNFNFGRYLTTAPGGNNQYNGTLDVYAGYLMGEVPLTGKLKAIGGARYETTDLLMTGFDGVKDSAATNEQVDLLPAASLVYSFKTNINLRLSWGQTIARPTFREIAPYRSYDATGDEIFQGNPNLKISSIDNYDVRWEWFPRPDEVISVGLFYKHITDPIEKYSDSLEGGEYAYKNFPEADLSGIEFEARKGLGFLDSDLERFSIGMNFALIQSEVPLSKEEIENKGKYATSTRPLFDQSPYVINLDLTYDNKRSGTMATLLANLTGERLYIVNGAGEDVYEHPAPTLDFVISQKLNRYLRLKFTARNLLAYDFKRTMGSDSDGPVYSQYNWGRTFTLALSAEF
ncbi:MAG TPA: TonB-dependent receptor [Candidatus Paceibacterota bacterium]|nr:TonB-dependent receptor [Verrucomicrobiota bacterium]HRY47717.1 TonB-dependent receptor [Candidatus Paceibacterota bacterium]